MAQLIMAIADLVEKLTEEIVDLRPDYQVTGNGYISLINRFSSIKPTRTLVQCSRMNIVQSGRRNLLY